MTPAQRELARHALGLPNNQRRSYRNRYFTTASHPAWRAMVAAGEAESAPSQSQTMFFLTVSGAHAALNPGETLDAEDFPQ